MNKRAADRKRVRLKCDCDATSPYSSSYEGFPQLGKGKGGTPLTMRSLQLSTLMTDAYGRFAPPLLYVMVEVGKCIVNVFPSKSRLRINDLATSVIKSVKYGSSNW
ncbi:hypothetical protein Y032_0006g2957 [Ancylostoma ceylanicum]|uniref:Uncharacterized protein n=1 Tax=Ancylostoma ceylanicum TaxID=53326 RepID=A0A016VRI8_9BILA|nr:hypothetical protein Y032_0006g2957 [Ancylostoma ceylanicum]